MFNVIMMLFVLLNPPARAEAPPETLRVLTQNMWGLPAILVKNKKFRVHQFCKELLDQSTSANAWDIVLIQELWMMRDRNLIQNCGYPYSVSLDHKSLDSGIMILSKYPIKNQYRYPYQHRYDPTHVDAERFPHKSALFALIEHPKLGDIWIINTHISAGNKRFTNNELKQLQIEELKEQVALLGNDTPIILGGDFNLGDGNGNPAWKVFLELFKNFSEPQKKCENPNRDTHWDTNRVDHIFTNGLLVPECGNYALDGLYKKNRKKDLKLSDHKGWEAVFSGSSG